MHKFQVTQRAHQVIFGEAVAEVLGREIGSQAIQSFFLVSTPGMGRRFESLVDCDVLARCAGRFTESVPHVPEEVALLAAERVRSSGAQAILAVGGGTAIDTAKAVSHRLHLPIIAIPTNFSGSEVTWNFGLKRNGVKNTVVDPSVLPKTVIYDPALLSTLSAKDAICSGVNAIAHAIEGMYAANLNPLTSAIAEAGVRALATGLPARHDKGRLEADGLCLSGAWLCGEVLSQVGMGLHHRICHVLGGTYNLPHAATHTVMLPYSIEFNYSFAPALSALAGVFGDTSLARDLASFSRRLGAPANLQELGFGASDIADAARLALATPVVNPRQVMRSDIEEILSRAVGGRLAS